MMQMQQRLDADVDRVAELVKSSLVGEYELHEGEDPWSNDDWITINEDGTWKWRRDSDCSAMRDMWESKKYEGTWKPNPEKDDSIILIDREDSEMKLFPVRGVSITLHESTGFTRDDNDKNEDGSDRVYKRK